MIARFRTRLQNLPVIMDMALVDFDNPIEGAGYTIETMEAGWSNVWVKTAEETMAQIRADERFEHIEDIEEQVSPNFGESEMEE